MEKQDISALINSLEPMMLRLKDNTNSVDLPVTFMALKMVLSELKTAAEEMPAKNNIKGVLVEVEIQARALAGLSPSYNLPKDQHYQFALNSISKLPMTTIFDL